ncbi:MAG: deoxyribose-phosphate aldolase [Ignavibacteriae bacterium]|jgi:deoxyribose-phosphate aldolase|nr:deoxyribose-phosphate aldolase [Ignavibacteriota bacterium]
MSITKAQFARMIDHTLLKNTAIRKDIELLCSEALEFGFASVCVHPFYVGMCSSILHKSSTKVCTVIGFPHGMHRTGVKIAETMQAIHDGAQEIDMVIQVGALIDGDKDIVWNDIRSVVDTAHQSGAVVKAIIETSVLNEEQKISACEIVSDAGADFIKTSTGFAGGGATIEDIRLLRSHIDPDIQVKASGGIRTFEQALAMIQAGATRIGTSSGVSMLSTL